MRTAGCAAVWKDGSFAGSCSWQAAQRMRGNGHSVPQSAQTRERAARHRLGHLAPDAHDGPVPANGAVAFVPGALERDALFGEDLGVRPEEGAREVVLAGLALAAPVDPEPGERGLVVVRVACLRRLGQLGRALLGRERQERREKVEDPREVGRRPAEGRILVAGEDGRRESPLEPEEAGRECERLGDERRRGEKGRGACGTLLERDGRIEGRVHAHTLSLAGRKVKRAVFGQNVPMRRNAGRMGLVLATLALLHAPAAQAETKNVLVLFSNARLLPANVEVEGALRETLAESKGGPVEVFAEFLDSPRFGGGSYATTMATYLREKYASRPPSAIVVAGAEALGFLLRNRGELFPEAPIVHVAVSRSSLQALQPLPANVVGVPGDFDFAGTIALALRLHSRARRVVVVTGASLQDRGYEAQARSALPQFAGRASVEFLSGLPTAALLERVKTLSPDAVVFTAGYFEDGDGRMFTPRAAAEGLARMSAVPVYAPFNTFLGTGIVGGRMPTFEAIGRQAGEIVATLLGGVALSSLRLPEAVPTAVHLDWRQARRWGIRDRDVPAGTVWHFREPTLWQSHRNWLIAAAAALLIQAALIAGLLVQSRRRREAVLASEQDRLRLVRASRLALAGELTGSIAHEINQPLGAILSNAAAGELILASGGDRRGEVLQILADIRRDDQRASDVIRRLRALLAGNEVERQPFEFNEVVSDLEPVLFAEARRRRMTLVLRPAASPVTLVGDRIQLQQVLINLVLNAMDAAADVPEERRTIVMAAERTADGVAVTVRDRGCRRTSSPPSRRSRWRPATRRRSSPRPTIRSSTRL